MIKRTLWNSHFDFRSFPGFQMESTQTLQPNKHRKIAGKVQTVPTPCCVTTSDYGALIDQGQTAGLFLI